MARATPVRRSRVASVLPPLAALLVLLTLGGCSAPSSAQPGGGGEAPAAATDAATGTTKASPSPSPSPVDPDVAAAERALARLDARARAAQLLVVGVPLDDLARGDALLTETPYGGVFLAGRSQAAAADVGAVTTRWTDAARQAGQPAPWVAADQEGGAVQTFTGPGFADLPTARSQGQQDPAAVRELARGIGASLRTAGVTLDLAPVADVVPAGTARSNEPIGRHGRQYGATAAEVNDDAAAVIAGLGEAGVVATVKHFPGLGRVTGNTDTSADVRDTTTTADDADVALFGELAALPQRPFVMTSSAVYEQIDPSAPAVFSPAVVTDLLRDRLGVDGVVISDDLGRAKAVTAVPVAERATRFVEAGGTLVLTVDAAVAPTMLSALTDRAAADPAFAARVDEAALVALVAKSRAGLLP
ncbi:beta-N-acetylhexosaminidase [Quadrisphaera granulorum]|uniref:beta-N-acetylhexosaminidase n=1 Tax=Quadrisphaera granulorum TaxID=317664 RepID=A0A316A533_9ACTN|nr:glycoside hydrolase family 3 N-terminal domain-containing protein [Quadrisphaera granulorum]PWJ53026.1 beta-N-acetylhexosaminidase [Quadrisphaera granulorum]SZE97191.1 beta-N-acetylhexosaminidase [Quadrisphaera granulorum]